MDTPALSADDHRALDRLFRPGSVAVIGASSTPSKIGGLPIAFLLANGYRGHIYPINPKAETIQGLPAYHSIATLSGEVDLAIIAVPAALAPAAVDDAIAARVRGIVLFSSGFAEIDEDGARTQAALVARARAAGVRVLGPNCLGFMNFKDRVFATFSPVVAQGVTPVGRIGLVSQSGAYGAYSFGLARARRLGLSYWITTGNEGDVSFADALAWLAEDPDTDVILGYMEGCRDGRKLEAALAAARAAGKPVVITKVGRTEIGAQAAASHTAALAGEDAIFDAVFRQYGVYRACSIEEFFDIGYAVSVAGKPAGSNLGIYTVSGGAGVLMADAAADAGLALPVLSDDGQRRIRELVPFAAPRNPVDITGQITNDIALLQTSMEIMLEHGDYQLLIVFLAAGGLGPLADSMARQVAAVRRRHPDGVFCAVSIFDESVRATLEEAGCLVFEDPTRAIRALAALAGFAGNEGKTKAQPVAFAPVKLAARSYSEAESFERLAVAGVPVPRARLVTSAAGAAEVAALAEGPLVAKIASPDIAHKSDVGGVLLNLRGEREVTDAYERIVAAARDACPEARIDGVLLSPMESGGVECIVGVQRDPAFGPVIMLGLGGVFVEVLRDVSFRTMPLSKADAFAMIDELRGRDLLLGARNRPPADIKALAELLVKVSGFAMATGDTLESLDINPVLVRPQGKGVVALDGLLIGRSPSAPSRNDEKRRETTRGCRMNNHGNPPMDLARRAKLAYLYTVPLIITETTRKWRMKKGANRFNHARKLLDHRSRWVTTPNNDTLYSDAWLDLANGPVTITVPATGERYFSLAFMDMYTNNFAILGTRTSGGGGGVYTVVGPDHAVPAGVRHVVRAPTARVWALARLLVDGEQDLPVAHAIQDGLFVHDGVTHDDVAPGEPTLRSADWATYLDAANRLLKRERPPATDGKILEDIGPLNIGPDQDFDAAAFNEEQGRAIAEGIEAARDYLVKVQGARGKMVQGWTYPTLRIGNFGENYTLRAVVAVGGLGALPLEEAMYMRADGDGPGGLFDGTRDYVLHFDADQMPPLNSFWSLSLYEATDDGMFFFADTPLKRYIIGDRSPGLTFNDDGSLDIRIGATNPGAAREANWLPAPPAPFALFFRGYMPRATLIDGGYRLPPVKHL